MGSTLVVDSSSSSELISTGGCRYPARAKPYAPVMDFRPIAGVIVELFFTTMEIEGEEHLPADTPMVLVANHHSSLVDALILLAATPVQVRSIGKSKLWRNPVLWPFLEAAEAIPVYRRVDGGGDNSAMFAEVRKVLTGGGSIGIFGEGTSHDGQGLMEIRTGAARMAIDAVNAGADLVIVPVGIVYEDRVRFRSHAGVRFGEPLWVKPVFDGVANDDRDAASDLTDMIETGLRTVAPVWESNHERAEARSAAISSLPVGASLLEVEKEAERLALIGADLPQPDPAQVGEHGEARIPAPPNQIDSGAAALLAVPAWAGWLLNLVPFTLIKLVAAGRPMNRQATLKLIIGVLLFPLWWTTIGVVVAMAAGSSGLGFAAALTVAVLGFIATRELPLRRRERETMRRAAARGQLPDSDSAGT